MRFARLIGRYSYEIFSDKSSFDPDVRGQNEAAGNQQREQTRPKSRDKDKYLVTFNKFAELGLSGRLLRALEDANYHSPTPIQSEAIPLLIDGRDLLGIAQTGTGKTAAFTLPLLHRLEQEKPAADSRQIKALILAPTRELAIQIADSVKTYGRHMRIRQTVVMGGVSQRPQVNALRRGVDILIATPGRLLDLVEEGHVDLRKTGHLILDEADRMLDMGFVRDVRRIVKALPGRRQTLLFSATMPKEINKLANEILSNPHRVEIAAKTVAVERIDQHVQHLDGAAKRARLIEMLAAPEMKRVIVFTRTKRGADRVVKNLERDGIGADALHGNKSQGARQRTLDSFRNGRLRVLVATDIAARGIDVDDITHVINYELPNEPENYVHRIGRTARAGSSGIAVSFCDESERPYLRSIERLIRKPIDVVGEMPAAPAPSTERKDKSGAKRPGAGARKRHRRSRRFQQRAA